MAVSKVAIIAVGYWLTAAVAVAQTADDQSQWSASAFADFASLQSAHSPPNHLFRSRGTTPRVDELNVNMIGLQLRKDQSPASPWGLEVTAQRGEDAKLFGFSATAPNLEGSSWLRHLGPTNVSYLAPVGNGLTVQGGVFSSFIGYDSLYAKDNFSYTRPWSADFTPYLMLGVNAAYPINDKLTFTAALINGYWHLAHANDVPTIGGRIAYRASDRMTLKQAVLYGPHQEETALDLWRWLSNTIVEHNSGRVRTTFDFHVSTERVASQPRSRAWWIAAQLPIHVMLSEAWGMTARPEFAWDSSGRWTTFEQTVAAITSTVAYRRRFAFAHASVRLEHRYDRSTGPAGGFYVRTPSGEIGLTPGQHLFILALSVNVARR